MKITEEEILNVVLDKLNKKFPPIDPTDDSDAADAAMDNRIKEGVKMLLLEKKKAGLPVALYDREKKQAYIEYPDGRKEYK